MILGVDSHALPFVGFVAVVEEDAAIDSGLEIERGVECPQPSQLRRALGHSRKRVRQLGEVEGALGIRIEIGHEGTSADEREDDPFHAGESGS